MYTGIVETTGRVVAVGDGGAACERTMTVRCPALAGALSPADSVSLSGVCPTATAVVGPRVSADLTQETCARSWFDAAAPGDRVDVERPARVGDRLDGHVVEGTVDATAAVLSVDGDEDGADGDEGPRRDLRVSLPEGCERHVVEKATLAVEGASLTVADRDDRSFAVALVPETVARTTLGDLAPGDRVNVETNVLATYAEAGGAAG